MKFFLLLTIVPSLVSLVMADSGCAKNAQVKINPDRVSDQWVHGRFQITGGNDATDISQDALTNAFNECFFGVGNCSLDKDTLSFSCQDDQEWKSPARIGSGNIEFDCATKTHQCSDIKWDTFHRLNSREAAFCHCEGICTCFNGRCLC